MSLADTESIEDTPWSPKTPLPSLNDDSLPESKAPKDPVTFHSVPLSSEFIAAFESARDNDSFERHVGALRDLSGIFATNLALQHVAKSPMLVRNWQRVLDELTGRSRTEAPGIGQELQLKFANEQETLRQDLDCASPALGLDGTPEISKSMVTLAVEPNPGSTLSSPEFIHSLVDDDRSFPQQKTQADRGLDREFIHYLRVSIARKRAEVELLKKLEMQRLKMINRLERVLRRKSLQLLTYDPSLEAYV
jgi:hypothetical protein